MRFKIFNESPLVESKEDIQKFVDKFGQNIYDNFLKAKDRLKNKNISTDIVWHVKNTSPDEMQNLLVSLYDKNRDEQRKRQVQGTDKEIRGKYKYLGTKGGYAVYEPLDVYASMDLGVNTGWCTTGRYGHYGHPEFTPSLKDAKEHWNDYTKRGIRFFYFLDPSTMYGEYAVALLPKIFEVNDVFSGVFITSVNVEIYNAKDELDYSISAKLPLDLIPEEVVIEEEHLTQAEGLRILGNEVIEAKKSVTDVVIPDGVTTIGSRAFSSCTLLTSVTIPSSVIKIGDEAFYGCNSLTSINIPNGVTEIGVSAFRGCTSLTQITIPNSVTVIHNRVFSYCTSLASLTIPDSVTEIGESAFSGCKSLISMTIPNSVTKIKKYAFRNCTSFTSIIIPDGVKIDFEVFVGCKALTVYTNNKNVILHCELEDIPCKPLTKTEGKSTMNFKILTEGTKYDKKASKIISDSGLFSPEISDKIIKGLFEEDIHAFVHSPAWLEKYLVGIARMLVAEANGDPSRAQQFLTECPGVFEEYLTWIKKVRTEENKAKLDDEFINKMSYQDVKEFLENHRKELDAQSKDELSKMTFTTSNYTLVPIHSYDEMHSLYGGRVTGDGSSDKYAGGGGTAWCHTNNEGVYNSWTNDNKRFFVLQANNWKDIPFDAESNRDDPKDAYGNSLIAILVNAEGALLNATLRCNHVGVDSNADNQYSTYAELSKVAGFNVEEAVLKDLPKIERTGRFEIEDGVLIKYVGHEEEITIPDNVTKIGHLAFIDCVTPTSITIPNSVTEIGGYAFAGCTSLTSVIIPNSVTRIGEGAFRGCTSLTQITIPNSVTVIHNRVFSYCTSLASLTIPDSVTEIGEDTFVGCPSLTIYTSNAYVIDY